MKHVLTLVQIAALLGVTVACVAVVMLFLQVRRTLEDAQQQLHVVAQKTALDLDEAHRVLLESGLTAAEARKASAEERAALPALTADAQHSFRSLAEFMEAAQQTTVGVGQSQQQIAASAVGVLRTTDETVRDLQPVMAQAKASLDELATVESDLDARVNDPAITESLHHIDASTAAMEASAQDVQQEVHKFTHPTWLHRMWSGMLDVAHVFNPL